MQVEKLFSIQSYDGKKALLSALREFFRALERHAPSVERMLWDEAQLLSDATEGTCLLIMLEDEVCGMADFRVHPFGKFAELEHALDTVYVGRFLIRPGYQGARLGSMLMDVVENYSRYLGKRRLRVMVRPEQDALSAFLTYRGFHRINMQEGLCYEMPLDLQLQVSVLGRNPSLRHQLLVIP